MAMFMNWLRHHPLASALLTIIRLYVGWEFLTAGWAKITHGFTAAGFLQHAVQNPVLGTNKQAVYPLFNTFLKQAALPHIGIFNILVPWGELLVGLGLILGILTIAAAFFGIVMNVAYLLAGTVSTNPVDILLSIFILTAGFNAARIGGDYWLIPWLRRLGRKTRGIHHAGPHKDRKHAA